MFPLIKASLVFFVLYVFFNRFVVFVLLFVVIFL